jgi:hypothetical protein
MEIYDILKDQRTNGNPLSNMMNRNVRVFDSVKTQVKLQIDKEINNCDSRK